MLDVACHVDDLHLENLYIECGNKLSFNNDITDFLTDFNNDINV